MCGRRRGPGQHMMICKPEVRVPVAGLVDHRDDGAIGPVQVAATSEPPIRSLPFVPVGFARFALAFGNLGGRATHQTTGHGLAHQQNARGVPGNRIELPLHESA